MRGVLVPSGWGWEGALGSFLRHGRGDKDPSICMRGIPQEGSQAAPSGSPHSFPASNVPREE